MRNVSYFLLAGVHHIRDHRLLRRVFPFSSCSYRSTRIFKIFNLFLTFRKTCVPFKNSYTLQQFNQGAPLIYHNISTEVLYVLKKLKVYLLLDFKINHVRGTTVQQCPLQFNPESKLKRWIGLERSRRTTFQDQPPPLWLHVRECTVPLFNFRTMNTPPDQSWKIDNAFTNQNEVQ